MNLISRYFEFLQDYAVLHAFWVNIQLTVLSGLLALVLGTIAVVMRISPVASLRAASTFYVSVFRDIPLTVVMVVMLSVVWMQLQVSFSTEMSTDFYILAIIGLGMYHSSFIAESLRSGINTVPLGQAEAARSIGLTFMQSARMIILPQAFRGSVAPIGNTVIALIKNTTVASVAGLATETSSLMKTALEFGPQFNYLIFFTFAIGYVIIVIPVGLLTTWLSRKLAVLR